MNPSIFSLFIIFKMVLLLSILTLKLFLSDHECRQLVQDGILSGSGRIRKLLNISALNDRSVGVDMMLSQKERRCWTGEIIT